MRDVLQTLETLSDDDLEAVIARAEELLQARLKKTPLAQDPAIGMWKDRDDMRDSSTWVREVRQRAWRV